MTIYLPSRRPVKVLRKLFYVREKEEWVGFITLYTEMSIHKVLMSLHVSYPSYYILQKVKVTLWDILSCWGQADTMPTRNCRFTCWYALGWGLKNKWNVVSFWYDMEIKKTITLKGIKTHPEPWSSRKAFLHKHNTLGETRMKYDGYKVMTE